MCYKLLAHSKRSHNKEGSLVYNRKKRNNYCSYHNKNSNHYKINRNKEVEVYLRDLKKQFN